MKNFDYSGVRLTVSGYGRTDDLWNGGAASEILLWVYQLGVSNEECLRWYPNSRVIREQTICAAAYNQTGQSSCQKINHYKSGLRVLFFPQLSTAVKTSHIGDPDVIDVLAAMADQMAEYSAPTHNASVAVVSKSTEDETITKSIALVYVIRLDSLIIESFAFSLSGGLILRIAFLSLEDGERRDSILVRIAILTDDY
ncbi:hypothetical protein RR46_02497 [Papilio xuthus]|uniref:Peptidase S1 domain-containing protein n=1 Tax=Papilio xuthus TaxID=66420 RepID=A0A194QIP3_PAPXU|nr:hypothetical protein RR46_02497 [Papilio xuthus]